MKAEDRGASRMADAKKIVRIHKLGLTNLENVI